MNIRIVRVDMKPTEKLLGRIADALEILAGVRPAPMPDVPADAEEAVAYSTEADLIREEFARLNGLPTDDEDDEAPKR